MKVNWNKIYSSRGLYSGHGSRGDCAKLKASAIATAIERIRPMDILDVGCGDLHVISQLQLNRGQYTGLDQSTVLLEQLHTRIHDYKLIAGDFNSMQINRTWGLVICLDVLIHIDRSDRYLRFARRLLETANHGLLISGFVEESPNTKASSVIHFHESFFETFSGFEVQTLGKYRDCVLGLVFKPTTNPGTDGKVSFASLSKATTSHDIPTPRIIWSYWETASGQTRPEYLDLCEQTWVRHCGADFEIIRITPENARCFVPDLPPCWENIAVIAHKADYLRAAVVHRHGGVWLDCDTIVLTNLTEMVQELDASGSDFIACGRSGNRPSNGIFAAKPGCNLLEQYINAMDNFLRQSDGKLRFGWTDIGYKLLWPLSRNYKYFQYEFRICIPVPPSKFRSFFETVAWQDITQDCCDIRSDTIAVYLYNAMFPRAFKSMDKASILAGKMVISQLFRKALGIDEPETVQSNCTSGSTKQTTIESMAARFNIQSREANIPTTGSKLQRRFCYWSIATGALHQNYARAMVKSARSVGVAEDIHVWANPGVRLPHCNVHVFDRLKHYAANYMFKLEVLKDVAKLPYDYFVFLDADSFFVRDPDMEPLLRLAQPLHLHQETPINSTAYTDSEMKSRSWHGMSLQEIVDAFSSRGISRRRLFLNNAGLFVIERKRWQEVYDCCWQGYRFLHDELGFPGATEECGFAWAISVLSDPERHSVLNPALNNVWCTDRGCFKDRLPADEPFEHWLNWCGNRWPVNPAIVHAVKSKPQLLEYATNGN